MADEKYAAALSILQACRLAISHVRVPSVDAVPDSERDRVVYWRLIEKRNHDAQRALDDEVWKAIALDCERKVRASAYLKDISAVNPIPLEYAILENGFSPSVGGDLNRLKNLKIPEVPDPLHDGLCPVLCSEWLSLLQCLRMKMQALDQVISTMNSDISEINENITQRSIGRKPVTPERGYISVDFKSPIDNNPGPPGGINWRFDCFQHVKKLTHNTTHWSRMIDIEITALESFDLPKSDSSEKCN